MQILLGRPIRCIGCILSLLNEQSSDRQHYIRKVIGVVPFMLATLIVVTAAYGQRVPFIPNGIFFPNPGGASQTYSTTGGGIDLTGPFFQSLGTNGRTCGSCHQPSDGCPFQPATSSYGSCILEARTRFSVPSTAPIATTISTSPILPGCDLLTVCC